MYPVIKEGFGWQPSTNSCLASSIDHEGRVTKTPVLIRSHCHRERRDQAAGIVHGSEINEEMDPTSSFTEADENR